MGTIHSHKG